MNSISIKNAYENNLKHIDVEIPKEKLVVFAGVSGSGKSSLVFDTIGVESSREWQSNYPLFLRNKMPHFDRPKVDEIINLTPSIVIDQKTFGASSRSTVGTAIDVAPLIRLLFSRIGKPTAGGSMAYSFNHPMGMCHECTGLGEKLVLREELLFDKNKSLKEGGINFSQFSNGWQTYLYQANPLLNPNKKLKDFTKKEWNILKYGSDEKIKVEIKSNNTGRVDKVDYEGVIPRFNRLYLKRDITKLKKSLQDEIMSLVHKGKCNECEGSGLNKKALKSKINGYNIIDYNDMLVSELVNVVKEIDNPIGISISKQIIEILDRMINVGIGYLSLSRKTDTLSGGELQRIKMVRNLSCSLTNITYIFDEPTQGLHPYDAKKIGDLLLNIRDKGNNAFVVEHSRQMIELADHIIEMGAGSGINGGKVIFEGSLKELKKTDTNTGLSLNEKIVLNDNPKVSNEFFEIKNAKSHNLKNVSVKIPKGVLVAVTGVAGSGKSSLICEEFVNKYSDSIVINQKPIGVSIRSNPATYIGIMDEIRKVFANENGVDASYFSFNSKGGCPVCGGTGKIIYDMAFAEPVEVVCEECQGHRYDKKVLNYKFNGKNIEEVLNLTIDEALIFFDSVKNAEKIKKPLKSLYNVGLSYMTLGQSTNTMSGGEIQRIKLASELHKNGNVYILDEPSSGLHNKDLDNLLTIFKNLVENGNSVIIIEHRLELIAKADYIIDMGPDGGANGGEVIFKGTPKEIINCKSSKTGKYLKNAIM